ncbi:hypothetical protein F7U66_01105 [Vibrio parahaemolyticus]|nr:hypothetical protein [Vibrio parahaemolyticus]
MALEKIIFNKTGKWLWLLNNNDLAMVGKRMYELGGIENWYQANVVVPSEPNYDTSIHDRQVQSLLLKKDHLKPFTLNDVAQKEAWDLYTIAADSHTCQGSGKQCQCNDTLHEHCIHCDEICAVDRNCEI